MSRALLLLPSPSPWGYFFDFGCVTCVGGAAVVDSVHITQTSVVEELESLVLLGHELNGWVVLAARVEACLLGAVCGHGHGLGGCRLERQQLFLLLLLRLEARLGEDA